MADERRSVGVSRELDGLLAPVRGRIRAARAMDGLAIAFVAASGVLGSGLVARFAYSVNGHWFFVSALAVFVATLVAFASMAVEDDEAAARADASHDLDDRLRAAVDFARKPDPTDFESAAIADALSRARIDPRRAVPFAFPRRAVPTFFVTIAAAVLLLAPYSRARPRIRPEPAQATRVALDVDTIEATRVELERLRRESRGHSIDSDLRALESLLDAIERGTVDAEEAFRRLDEIGRRVASEPRAGERAEALARAAANLGDRSERLDATLEAMRNGDAERAAESLAALASAMREGSIDRRELERMRESFQRMADAARERAERREELLRRRDELRREIEESSEPSLLERRQRELDRLERELEDLEEQRRELERLERELEEAAEDLSRNDPSSAAEDLEDAFEDLNRMAHEQMGEQEQEQLREQLEQLREAMRRQREQSGGSGEESGGGGSSQGMQRFRLRAGGSGGREVRLVGPGQGGGSAGSGGSEGEGSESSGGGSQPGGNTPGGSGEGQGMPGGSGGGSGDGPLVMELRPGGEGADAILELPNGALPGSRGSGGSGGDRRASSGAGSDHDPQTLDEATNLDSEGETSTVEGERAAGETRSQVIRGAASSGFAGRGYRSVHADYADHAEEILDRENVPPGYRYYVRRYFQLIRPREESNP